MMYFVISFIFIYLGVNVTNGASVSVPGTINGILGNNVVTIECQYGQDSNQMLNQIEWQVKQNNGRYVQLAVAMVTPDDQAKTEVVTDNSNLAFTARLKSDKELTFQMTFLRILCEDGRDYKCRASFQDANNRTQTSTASTRLNVQDRPDKAPSLNFNTPIRELENTEFTCSGIVGRPAGKLVWRTSTDAQDLQIQTVSQKESSCLITRTERLTMPLTRLNKTMTISCEIEHDLASSPLVTTVGPLNIIYPPDEPSITTEPNISNTVLVAGTSMLKLTCSTDSNPVSSYKWMFNGEPAGNESELMIQMVDLSHAGNYTCNVTNTLGERSNSVDIMVGETTTTDVSGSGTSAGQTSASMTSVVIAVVLTSVAWVVILVIVVIIYRKKICGGTIKKRKLKEIMPPVSGFTSSNYEPNYSRQKNDRDKTALTNFGTETDDYLVPDEINVPHRMDSIISHQYENTPHQIYSKAGNINNVDHNGYTLSRVMSHPENYYDEILRKNTVKSDISDYNHDYMEPI